MVDDNGRAIVNGGETLTINGNVDVSDTAMLNLTNGAAVNATGTITTAVGTMLLLGSGASISSSGGEITLGGLTALGDGSSITGTVADGTAIDGTTSLLGDVSINNRLVLEGDLSLGTTGNVLTLNSNFIVALNGQITSTGGIISGTTAEFQEADIGGDVQMSGNVAFSGLGPTTIGANTSVTSTGGQIIVNNSTANPLNLNGSLIASISAVDIQNNSRINMDGGSISGTSVDLYNNASIISIGNSSITNLNKRGTIDVNGGTLTLTDATLNDGLINVDNESILAGNILTTNGGYIRAVSQDTVISADFDDDSAQLQLTYTNGATSSSEMFSGNFHNRTINSLEIMQDTATFIIDGDTNFDIATSITNSGSIAFYHDFTVTNYNENPGTTGALVDDATVNIGTSTSFNTLTLTNPNAVVNVTGSLDINELSIESDIVYDNSINASGMVMISDLVIRGIGGFGPTGNSLTLDNDMGFGTVTLEDNAEGHTLDLVSSTLFTNGNLNIGENGTIKSTINSDVDYGKVLVGGNLVIDTTKSTLDLTVASGAINANETKEYDIFELTLGSITGSFTDLVAQNNRYTVAHVADGRYSVTYASSAADVALEEGGSSANARIAGAWVDDGGFTPGSSAANLSSALDALSQNPAQARDYINALNTLAPDVAPSNQSAMSGNVAQVMGGYDFAVKDFTVTPETGLRYVNIQNDGYTDSVAQKIAGNSMDILTGVVGVNASSEIKTTKGFNLTPKLNFALTYDMHNDDGGAVVTLANGSSYNVTGEALKRFGAEVGTGLGFEFDNGMELSIDYNGKFREDYTDHTGLITAKYKF